MRLVGQKRRQISSRSMLETDGRYPVTLRSFRQRGICFSLVAVIACLLITSWHLLDNLQVVEPEIWPELPANVPLARRVWPSELLSRPIVISAESPAIPQIIHQSWMVDTLPGKFERWSLSWRTAHPNWQWTLWTDRDNRKLVKTHFPWLLEAYNAMPEEISRADAARNMYMYVYGGIYTDLDMECLRSFDGLFQRYDASSRAMFDSELLTSSPTKTSPTSRLAVFGTMGYDGSDKTLQHTIPNAWMAASPGHPFFLYALQNLSARVLGHTRPNVTGHPEELTGPVALYNAIQEYQNNATTISATVQETHKILAASRPNRPSSNSLEPLISSPSNQNHSIHLLAPEAIYPYSWNNAGLKNRKYCWATSRNFNTRKCKARVTTNESYAITYWSHVWNDDFGNAKLDD